MTHEHHFETAHADQDNVRKIRDKILDATKGEPWPDMMSALRDMLIFHISLACPDCRKANVKHIRQRLPEWLTAANRLAAQYKQAGGGPH